METLGRKAPKYLGDHSFKKKLHQRIDVAFCHLGKRDIAAHYLKALVMFVWALGSYISLYFVDEAWGLIVLCLVSGVGHTALGFNVFHDAIHGSLSHHKSINRFFAFLTCSLLGVSHYLWRFKHNYLHHQFTNVEAWDDDLETRDALKLSPKQKSLARYRYQHFYAPLVYSLTSLEWVFLKDFIQYFTLKINQYQKIPPLKLIDHFEFWISKAIYFTFYVALPLVFFGPVVFFIGLIIFHTSHSLAMASVFQLAHVMPDLEFPEVCPKTGTIDRDIQVSQLKTTVNFATKSAFMTWYSGGLNYQVEHHLFPRISHIHYPMISKIVKETAEEFQLPYHEIPTFGQALSAHFKALKKLGNN